MTTEIQHEEWRPIAGFPEYSVSSLGRVASHHYGKTRLRKPGYDRGYGVVVLRSGGRSTTRRVHQLVAEAFIGRRPEGLEVRHVNGDATDSSVSNLCYGTRAQNEQDKLRHGTHHFASRARCKSGHLFDEKNTRMENGARRCRACAAIRSTAYRQRQMFRAAGIAAAA